MKLLVSVSDAEEALLAVEGGADIIDAKDPTRGALGAVSPRVFGEIRSVVRDGRLVTAALGDATDPHSIEQLAHEYAARGADLVKVGFARIADLPTVELLLAAAVRGAEQGGRAAGVIAVAYADARCGESIEATSLMQCASRAGARGVLVDTVDKHGPGLPALWTPDDLAAWVGGARSRGLIAAVAGRLSGDDLQTVCDGGADVAGVRGAACDGGRMGRVSAERVRALSAVFKGSESLKLRSNDPLGV